MPPARLPLGLCRQPTCPCLRCLQEDLFGWQLVWRFRNHTSYNAKDVEGAVLVTAGGRVAAAYHGRWQVVGVPGPVRTQLLLPGSAGAAMRPHAAAQLLSVVDVPARH